MSRADSVKHREDVVDGESNTPLNLGGKVMVPAKSECKVSSCAKSAITDLAGKDLCLDHFLTSCYEQLDELEPVVCRRSLEGAENLAAGVFLEECSKRTLFICLRHESLSNLDRSRLLDILLQVGHLQLQLRKPVAKRADSVSELSAIFFVKIPGNVHRAEDQKDN